MTTTNIPNIYRHKGLNELSYAFEVFNELHNRTHEYDKIGNYIGKALSKGLDVEYQEWRNDIAEKLRGGKWPNLLKAMEAVGYEKVTSEYNTSYCAERLPLFGPDSLFNALLFRYEKLIIQVDVLFFSWEQTRPLSFLKRTDQVQNTLVFSEYTAYQTCEEAWELGEHLYRLLKHDVICPYDEGSDEGYICTCWLETDAKVYNEIEKIFTVIDERLLCI